MSHFDVLHKIAEEYFHRFCPDEKKMFSHMVGPKAGHQVGYFYLNYKSSDPTDFDKY